jgi:thymidylate kinase
MYYAVMVSPTRLSYGLERVTLTRYVISSVAYDCQRDTTLNNISDTVLT